jgi:hypothetical protein
LPKPIFSNIKPRSHPADQITFAKTRPVLKRAQPELSKTGLTLHTTYRTMQSMIKTKLLNLSGNSAKRAKNLLFSRNFNSEATQLTRQLLPKQDQFWKEHNLSFPKLVLLFITPTKLCPP